MPRIEYTRRDLVISLRPAGEGRVLTTVGEAPEVALGECGLDLDQWLNQIGLFLTESLPSREWRGTAAAMWRDEEMPRVVLRIAAPRIASLAWESAVAYTMAVSKWPVTTIVVTRDTPVPPRDADTLWTLPLRIVHVDAFGESSIRDLVRGTFGTVPKDDVETAVSIAEVPLDELPSWRPTAAWPTAEVVHFDRLPSPESSQLLSTASDRVGTLGWLSRFADDAQTRLVVIRCESEEEMGAARMLGSALTARGGPAVLAVRTPGRGAGGPFHALYDYLVHDRPLDWIVRELRRWYPDAPVTLFTGAGREEAIRVSGPGLALRRMAESAATPEGFVRLENELRDAVREVSTVPVRGMELEAKVDAAMSSIEAVGAQWDGLAFERHESEGFIPYANKLHQARATVFGPGPAPVRRGPRAAPLPTPEALESPRRGPSRGTDVTRGAESAAAPRFVNTSLSAPAARGARERIPQAGARLTPGRVHYLEIGVGRRDETTRTLGAAELLNEGLNLRPDDTGARVEVGVTGISFDVLGDPVQELWIPRDGDSATLRFAVVPRGKGVSVLRFCLYHKQNAVQTFRVAALTLADDGSPPADATALLAAALGSEAADVDDAGWLTRLEYSRVASPAAIPERPDRALSIVANHLAGRPVVTVKGADTFEVEFPGPVNGRVARMRSALSEIASPPVAGVPRDLWPYAFGRGAGAAPNEGDDATLRAALIRLAEDGWQLYTQLVPRAARDRLKGILEEPDRVIQVAHVLIDKVIPWSLVYDRPFRPSEQTDAAGDPLQPDACLAALPRRDGTLPVRRCGESPQCLLHQRAPESVACPLGFWGFRHIVEVPPQQSTGETAARQEADAVGAASPAVLVAAFNSSLASATEHERSLRQLTQALFGAAEWKTIESLGQEVVRLLNDPDLDLAYLYCHARGGVVDPSVKEPCLEFVGLNSKPRQVTSADLADGPVWTHRPLFVLNGCGTVGFSPDALSPFLPILVRDRGAAGLIGAEISVWEQLAGEFALHFLRAFLSGSSAGRALIHARRMILAQKNPLGLVYTLYANADLVLRAPPSDAGA